MWCIIWNIDGRVRRNDRGFESPRLAHQFAKYYKSLLEIHHKGKHIQKRFCDRPPEQDRKLDVSYSVTKKLETSLRAYKLSQKPQ